MQLKAREEKKLSVRMYEWSYFFSILTFQRRKRTIMMQGPPPGTSQTMESVQQLPQAEFTWGSEYGIIKQPEAGKVVPRTAPGRPNLTTPQRSFSSLDVGKETYSPIQPRKRFASQSANQQNQNPPRAAPQAAPQQTSASQTDLPRMEKIQVSIN